MGGGLLALFQLCQRAFAGQVVAELPFEPVWWFRGLARRGLPEGHAANACGMVGPRAPTSAWSVPQKILKRMTCYGHSHTRSTGLTGHGEGQISGCVMWCL